MAQAKLCARNKWNEADSQTFISFGLESVMGPSLFILAVLGCGEGDASCQQVAQLPTQYASVDACNEASEAALSRYMNVDFPVVVTQCRRVGEQIASDVKGDEVKLPSGQRPSPVRRATYKPGQRARG